MKPSFFVIRTLACLVTLGIALTTPAIGQQPGTTTATYDNGNKLTKTSIPTADQYLFQYDSAGNLTNRTTCLYSISGIAGNTISWPATGGNTGNLTVTATGGCEWSYAINPISASWIIPQTKPTFNFRALLNPGASRTATLRIAGQDYTVTQAAKNGPTCGVFRPTAGYFFLRNTNNGGNADLQFPYGQAGDVPIVGDWNADGVDTVGIFRNGMFYLRNSNSGGFADIEFAFGQAGDIPVAGDWDGDGTDTIGVFRNGQFLLRNTNSTGPADFTIYYGQSGDKPVVGDWDGNGTDTIGIYRDGTFYLRNSNSTGFADIQFPYGIATDVPVIGDWNADGIDTIGIFRGGMFYLRDSNSSGDANIQFPYGAADDVPVMGDWNGLP